MCEFLRYISRYKSQNKKGVKPDYLVPFLNFIMNKMQEYGDAVKSGSNPDWRLKEALILAVGCVEENMKRFDDLN